MMNKIISIVVFVSSVLVLFSCQQNKENKGVKKQVVDNNSVLPTLDALNAKIRNNPDNPDHYQQRAVFYIEQEEFTQAFKDITSALLNL